VALQTDENVEQALAIFHALADETRLRVLEEPSAADAWGCT
jgi:DNA-binding transcriptional ArsR family regulator